jgi:L-cysteine S-thiosulfotransferase
LQKPVAARESIYSAFHPHCQRMVFMLFSPYIPAGSSPSFRETSLIAAPSMKTAVMLALLTGTVFAGPAVAQSAADGQKLAFDRSKGNCLTCHAIKGGEYPGTIGPALTDIKSRYPNRDELVAILTDETKRNPLTQMPPFGRNRILTDQEISAIVDFLQTL